LTIDVVTVVGRRNEPLLTIAARQLAQAASEAGCDLCAPTTASAQQLLFRIAA